MDAKKPPGDKTPAELAAELQEPFPPSAVGWKPQIVKNDKAMVAAYIDARDVQGRLDQAAGVPNWQDDYEILDGGSVVCRLRVRFGPEWVTKTDVGSPSEQPDGGDRLKAAFSDALKRAAVKYGIGRYLYSLPTQWVAFDAQKKRVAETPTLPDWAVPSGYKTAGPELADKVNRLAMTLCQKTRADPGAYTAGLLKAMNLDPSKSLAGFQARFLHAMLRKINADVGEWAASLLPEAFPQDGPALLQRLAAHDAKSAGAGLWPAGELLHRVLTAGARAGYPADLQQWNTPAAIRFAVETAKEFQTDREAERDRAAKSRQKATPTTAA